VQDVIFYLVDRIRLGSRGAGFWWETVRQALALAGVGGPLRWFLLAGPRGYVRDPRSQGPRPYRSLLNNVLWSGLRAHGLPEILHTEDALSMAFSIESRTPFLDHRLVELCFSLPFDEKVADGWTKSLLRRSMAGVVPPEILSRRAKFGLGAPVGDWLALEGNWQAVRELLLDPEARRRGILDAGRVSRLLTAFRLAPRRHALHLLPQLWSWITLELWFRDFIDRPVEPRGGSSAVASRAD
jgi:asparagine synthase (glutamine-hydrolysing)